MSELEIVIGSGNAHKVEEIRTMLDTLGGVRVVPFTNYEPVPEVEETGQTFEENAALKATLLAKYLYARRGAEASGRHTAVGSDTANLDRLAATRAREFAEERRSSADSSRRIKLSAPRIRASDVLVLADDSGLMVDVLGGRPGVLSARYAGRHGDDAANNAKLLDDLSEVIDDKRGAKFVAVLTLANQNGVLISARGEVNGRIARETKGNQGFGYDPLFFYPPFNATFGEVTAARKNDGSLREGLGERLTH